MKKILLDTNILIDYSKGYSTRLEKLLKLQEVNRVKLYINSVVIAEYFADRYLKDKEKLRETKEFFQLFTNVDITKKTGLVAGELLRENQVNASGDALIAASCLQFDLQLYTNNKKDFREVKKIKLFDF